MTKGVKPVTFLKGELNFRKLFQKTIKSNKVIIQHTNSQRIDYSKLTQTFDASV